MQRYLVLVIILLSACQSKTEKVQETPVDLREQINAVNTDRERDFIQDADLPNIIEIVAMNDALGTLTESLMAAELVEMLQGAGPYTIFAPSNDAFSEIPDAMMDDLLKPGNTDQIKAIMQNHIHKGIWKSAEDVNSLKTVQGKSLSIKLSDNGKLVNGAVIISADIDAANGVVHVIDKVLMPE